MQPHENKDIIIHVCQRKQSLRVCYIEVPLPQTTSSFIQISMHTKLVPHRPSSPWALPHGSQESPCLGWQTTAMQTSVSHIVQLYYNLGWPVSSRHEDATNTPGRAKATTHAGAPRSGTGELRSSKEKYRSEVYTYIYPIICTLYYHAMFVYNNIYLAN